MLALFWQSHATGGVDLDFPQSSVAVTCCDRVVSQFDRARGGYRERRGCPGGQGPQNLKKREKMSRACA